MTATSAYARAKINLALHVTGRRADGYHLLDSLIGFAGVGDTITAEHDRTQTLQITGPRSGELSTTDNLVLRAARILHPTMGARMTLDKHLPVASGIGGGSADAAATLHALSQLWSLPLPDVAAQLTLGADVPVCVTGQAARMQGIGEQITPLTLPKSWVVLANPGVALSTPQVFATLQTRTNRGLDPVPPLPDTATLANYLKTQRNHLQPAACALAPVISDTVHALQAQTHCLFARMSGSGATCFGLFATEDAATRAAQSLHKAHPHWWIAPALLT